MASEPSRRPIRARSAGWIQSLARGLGAAGLTPNAISTLGIVFAAGGAAAFYFAGAQDGAWLWWLGALGIQLRLMCNLLDGLVAVEGGQGSPTGPLFNEVPDRVEDALLLLAAGYGAGAPAWGVAATLFALFAPYLRATGVALGQDEDFVGPMAKQHRMFTLTLAAILAGFELEFAVVEVALIVISVGTALTCLIRLQRIARGLRRGAGA